MARLNQGALDKLIAGGRDVEDIYPLSPIQTLFYSAHPGAILSEFDQWQCTLRGSLDVSSFKRAWRETLNRHTVLRSTIHGEGLHEPMQIVHRDVEPLWTIDDWSGSSPAHQAELWSSYLSRDRSQPLNLTEAPVSRFSLIKLNSGTWKFLWTVPALLLDGWSWPVVFRDANLLYQSYSQNHDLELERVRPYRDYLEWLSANRPSKHKHFGAERSPDFASPCPYPLRLQRTGKVAAISRR